MTACPATGIGSVAGFARRRKSVRSDGTTFRWSCRPDPRFQDGTLARPATNASEADVRFSRPVRWAIIGSQGIQSVVTLLPGLGCETPLEPFGRSRGWAPAQIQISRVPGALTLAGSNGYETSISGYTLIPSSAARDCRPPLLGWHYPSGRAPIPWRRRTDGGIQSLRHQP